MAVDLHPPVAATMAISTEERSFFEELGERIARLRREHDITQVQLAQALGVSQQTMQSYEVGRRRIPVSALPVVAQTLKVSLEELFGQGRPAAAAARGKRGPASKMEQHLARISALPKPRQRAVMDVIEAMLAQQGR
jgi:transcriptional regulator with XRE-family HTH domain